ncbi:MAG: hypothetical protein PHS54_05260 [Clostridia bacterium]|nr:hypothetical protein [Clostridia bacterium]
MDNKKYFECLISKNREKWGEEKYQEALNKMLSVAKKYENNKWWLKNDATMAYYQLNEPTLLVKFDDFHIQLEKLINRSVWTHEFTFNFDALKKQAEEAFRDIIKKSPEELRQEENEGIETIRKGDVSVITLVVDDDYESME